MNRKLYYLFAAAILGVVVSACNGNKDFPIQDKVWVPVYSPKADIHKISVLGPKVLEQAGKIYAYDNYLFQLEPGKGIHIYKITDKIPETIQFIQVFGAEEMAIRDNILYTNNYDDLVSIDISNPDNIGLLGRAPNVFQHSGTRPPESGYFQCVDTTKGIVTGWELQENVPANCKY